MRTSLLLSTAALLMCTAAHSSTATVNAGESRAPIDPGIYGGAIGDAAEQERLAAQYGIALPPGELARVALLGTLGQKRVTVFNEGEPQPVPSAAVELYTDYDGEGSGFGTTSIQARSSSPALLVFASFDSEAKVTVVLVNQSAMAADAVELGFQGIGQKGNWRAFELTADGRIAAAGAGTLYEAVLTRTVQPHSAMLVEYRPVGGILPIRTPPELILRAAGTEEQPVTPPMGCSATEFGVLSLSLLALLGVVRRRSQR